MAVAGLLPDGLTTSGEVRLADSDIEPVDRVGAPAGPDPRLRTGMVFQEPMTALNPTMKVGRQVAEVMVRHRTRHSRGAAVEAAIDLLGAVDLPDPRAAGRRVPAPTVRRPAAAGRARDRHSPTTPTC